MVNTIDLKSVASRLVGSTPIGVSFALGLFETLDRLVRAGGAVAVVLFEGAGGVALFFSIFMTLEMNREAVKITYLKIYR